MKDWPLEPITLIDDIPFLIVITYMKAGESQHGASPYLRYCISDADWTTRRYHTVTKQEIETGFQKLLNSPIWKQPLDKWELGFIRKQTE